MGIISGGRKFMVVVFTVTYCLNVFLCAAMVFVGKLTIEAFLGIFAGLTGIIGAIQTFYFLRTDRPKEETKEEPKEETK